MGRRCVADHGDDSGKTRGIVSGLLQAGYPSGYLLAAVLYGTSYHFLGWRGMFMVGALPAFLVLFIRRNVEESPAWRQRVAQSGRSGTSMKGRWKLFVYVIILITAFNSATEPRTFTPPSSRSSKNIPDRRQHHRNYQ